jgi:hypothetical protein
VHARLVRVLATFLAFGALAGAGLAGNYLLLRYADSRHDPVGRLTPRGTIGGPGTATLPQTTDHEHHDHHGKTVEEPDD